MARRGRSKRSSGVEATGIGVLLIVGAIVWAVQTLWPLLVMVAVGGLVAYIARRSIGTAPAQAESRSDVELEPAIVTRRSGPGSVVFELSLGQVTQRAAEP